MKQKLSILRFQPISLLFFLGFLVPGGLLIPKDSHASYSISPLIIEHTASPRDMFEETIKITNTTDRKVRIFPSVNEITLGSEGEIKEFIPPSMSDNTTSITSWLEITRGRVEINPGETIKIPVLVTINPNAKPGDYYAFIGLAEGSKRDEAELKVMSGVAPGVIVRVELADTKNEYLRLTAYHIDRFVTDESNATVRYEVENVGDVPVIPAGEIIVYNVQGQEIASVIINTDRISVPPGEGVEFTSQLPEVGFMGKFKAFLSLEYGATQAATIYDTTYFTLLPIVTITILFGTVLFLSMFGAVYYHRVKNREYDSEIDDDTAVAMYIRSGATSTEQDHDINLKK